MTRASSRAKYTRASSTANSRCGRRSATRTRSTRRCSSRRCSRTRGGTATAAPMASGGGGRRGDERVARGGKAAHARRAALLPASRDIDGVEVPAKARRQPTARSRSADRRRQLRGHASMARTQRVSLERINESARYSLIVDGKPYDVFAEETPLGFHIVVGGETMLIGTQTGRRGARAAGGAGCRRGGRRMGAQVADGGRRARDPRGGGRRSGRGPGADHRRSDEDAERTAGAARPAR